MSVTADQIEAGLQTLSGIDFASAYTAFHTANLAGEITSAEAVAGVVADFIPAAAYAKDALLVLGFIVSLQDAGLIRPAQPEDPAMSRVERETGGK